MKCLIIEFTASLRFFEIKVSEALMKRVRKQKHSLSFPCNSCIPKTFVFLSVGSFLFNYRARLITLK